MPEYGIEKMCHSDVLSYEDMYKLLKTLNRAGIKKVKITGGEPFVRRDAIKFIEKLKSDSSFEKVTVTTNGMLLDKYVDELIKMKIDGINISLDSLKEDRYKKLTRGADLKVVLKNIKYILESGYGNLKINTVLMDGINSDEILDFATLVRGNKISLRFIELMPIGEARDFIPVSREQVLKTLISEFGELKPINKNLGNGPAEYITFKNFKGNIGFIDAVNHKFCRDCNRIRMDSRGNIKFCLQYDIGIGTEDYLSGKISEDEFLKKLNMRICDKPLENNFSSESVGKFTMNQIGG